MRKATIRDICNDTGLSMGTVSKYLNGGVLKESNRKKIDAAIRKFDYRVDEYARGLITNRTKTVGVLITKMNNLFYTRIISHIEAFLYKKGYSTIIKESSGDLKKELDSIDWLISRRVDALVIIPVGRTKEDYRLLDNVGIPVVFLDSYIEGVNCESIVVDNENITYKASDYMIKNGHRKISVIADMNSPYTANARLAGVKRAFRDNAISEDSLRIYSINESLDESYQITRKIVQETDSTAIFASNYISTLGTVYFLNEFNVKVPDEISVLGFDDIMITNLYRPKLTIINQPIAEIAARTVTRLFELLGDENAERKINVLECELVRGQTIAKLD